MRRGITNDLDFDHRSSDGWLARDSKDKFGRFAAKLNDLGVEILEEHNRIVSTLRNENKRLRATGHVNALGLNCDPGSPGRTMELQGDSPAGTPKSSWSKQLDDHLHRKPRMAPICPRGATKTIGGQQVAKINGQREESGHSPLWNSEMAFDDIGEETFVCQHGSMLEADQDEEDGQKNAESFGEAVGATWSQRSFLARDRPEIFPRWFNPYIQETYHGKRTSTMSSGIRELRRNNSFLMQRPPCCVIMPLNRSKLTWDLVWMVCLLYEMWIIPIDLVFIEDGSMPVSLATLTLVSFIFFSIDIFLNFITAYIQDDKEVVDHKLIVLNYLKTWFLVDVLATVPWDWISSGRIGIHSRDELSTSRAAKATKALKVFKLLKLLRLAKVSRKKNTYRIRNRRVLDQLMNSQKKNMNRLDEIWQEILTVFSPLKKFVLPSQMVAVMLWVAHAHTPIYATLKEGWEASTDIDLVFRRYYEGLWWTFSILMFGSTPAESSPYMWTLSIILQAERFFFVFQAMTFLIFQAMTLREEDANMSLKQTHAMEYLKSHDISVRTQLQVLFNVKETARIIRRQRHFSAMLAHDLPVELRRQVCEELWSKHLLSLGLLWQVAEWNSDFLLHLAQLVREESYASKVVVFREGDSAIAAYRVLHGSFAIDSSFQPDQIPPFTRGMWIGERSLVTLGLRRTGSCSTISVSSLMAVPSNGFQAVLGQLGLVNTFQTFCERELWRGLCGRCGLVGDHFAHECPLIYMGCLPEIVGVRRWMQSMSTGLSNPKKKKKKPSMGMGHTTSEALRNKEASSRIILAHDIKLFLEWVGFKHLLVVMEDLGIRCLDDLQLDGNLERIRIASADTSLSSTALTAEDLQQFRPLAIENFKKEMADTSRGMLSVKMSAGHHFIFLSHYKLEAGTEAALMRAEIEAVIFEDIGHPAADLDAPIFLDSEDLSDLKDLMKAVGKSHNLVLMLTKGVLTRPWCVVEIATAVREGVPIIPVSITKPGCEFSFPDKQFYDRLCDSDGGDLGHDGMSEVKRHGFDMEEVADAIRKVFTRIAIPYSPHRTSAIRRAEIEALVRQSTCREIHDPGHHSPIASQGLDSRKSWMA